MITQGRHGARNHEFEDLPLEGGGGGAHLGILDLKGVRVPVTADLGNTHMKVRDILDLKIGSVVQLTKVAGEMTDIYVNGLPMARGEVVVIADSLHVRISAILGAGEEGKDQNNDD